VFNGQCRGTWLTEKSEIETLDCRPNDGFQLARPAAQADVTKTTDDRHRQQSVNKPPRLHLFGGDRPAPGTEDQTPVSTARGKDCRLKYTDPQDVWVQPERNDRVRYRARYLLLPMAAPPLPAYPNLWAEEILNVRAHRKVKDEISAFLKSR